MQACPHAREHPEGPGFFQERARAFACSASARRIAQRPAPLPRRRCDHPGRETALAVGVGPRRQRLSVQPDRDRYVPRAKHAVNDSGDDARQSPKSGGFTSPLTLFEIWGGSPRSAAPTAAPTCGSSPSSPTALPCATSSPTWVSRRRRLASRLPAERRYGRPPAPNTSRPPISRSRPSRPTSSTSALLGSHHRRAPSAPDAGRARVGGRQGRAAATPVTLARETTAPRRCPNVPSPRPLGRPSS